MSWEYVDKKRVTKIVNQIAGKVDDKTAELIEPVIIQGKGDIWCYQPNNRAFIRLLRGTMGYIVDFTEDSLGRVLFYSVLGDLVAIEREELLDIGFN